MKKKGVATEYLPWIIIAVIVLSIVMLTIFLLKDQGFALIDKLKGLGKG